MESYKLLKKSLALVEIKKEPRNSETNWFSNVLHKNNEFMVSYCNKTIENKLILQNDNIDNGLTVADIHVKNSGSERGGKIQDLCVQRYHYKEEPNFKWDENDYHEKNKLDSLNKNIDLREINAKVENQKIERGEQNEHPAVQKYHYKEELDLDWDEKDNNNYDERYDAIVKKSFNEAGAKKIEDNEFVLQNYNSQLPNESSKLNVTNENPQNERDGKNMNLNPEKLLYKEELNLDWDEADNKYDDQEYLCRETFMKKSVKKKKRNSTKKNRATSLLQDSQSVPRTRKINIENPDTEKDCPRCKKRLKNQNTLVKHLFYCGKAPHLQCDSCTYRAKYKNALITHIIRNHPQQIPNFKKNKTTQKKGIKKNMIPKEHQQSDKYLRFCTNCNVSIDKLKLNKCNKCESCLLYQCRKCTATFQSREKLTRHIIDKCDPKGYYHCPACDFKATSKQTVKFHLTIHLVPGSHLDTETIKWKEVEKKDGDTPHLFTCPSCGKQFQRKASLANHMRFCIKSQGVSKPAMRYIDKKKSLDIKNLVLKSCSKCNNQILNGYWSQTISECCESMILYKCLKCDRSYDYMSSIYYHVKSVCYTQTKYKCDLCDYEGIANNLARHRQRKHDYNSVALNVRTHISTTETSDDPERTFFTMFTIKKEPDDPSKFIDEEQENLNPQKYYYETQLDLKWEEKGSVYDKHLDETCKVVAGKFTEESQTIKLERDECILPKWNTHLKEINVNIEQSDIDTDKINDYKNFQNYHYKEELDIDWDEKDNNYEQNHDSYTEEPIEKRKIYEVEKNKTESIFQQHSLSRNKNMKIENPDTTKDCPKCNKQLKNLNTLKKHLYYCGKAPHLQCDSCSYKAKYKNALIVHIMRNHPHQISILRKRKTTTKVKSKSNKIVNEQQENDKCLRFCSNCNVAMDKPAINNCNKCESWLLYQCKKCNLMLNTRVDFNRHMNNTCDPKGYYHCPGCDYKSTFKKHVKIHLKGHLPPGSHVDTEVIKWKSVKEENGTENLFTCPSCGKQFQRQASLSSHTRLCVKSQGVSKPPPRYVENENRKKGRSRELARYCSNCNNDILSNKIRKSKCCQSSISFKCLKCNKTSEDHKSMKHHVKNICFKVKCDLCDFEGSQIRVTAHRLYKHDNNSVECPKCKTVVRNKRLLYDHSNFCGKEPFKCGYCSFKSKRKYRLNAHILKKHPEQRENVNSDFAMFPQ